MNLFLENIFKKYVKVIKKQVVAIAVISLFSILIGLYWLSILIVMLSCLYFWVLSFPVIRKNYFLTISFLSLFFVGLSILTRVFVLEIYRVPSSSMENALYPGDHIILSKLNYGPKLPRSPFEIPWVNLLFYADKTASDRSGTLWWTYHRWSGFSAIKHNDIVVFKRGDDESEFLVKRCIGVAGDTLKIENGQLYLNKQYIKDGHAVKFTYMLEVEDEMKFVKLADSLQVKYSMANRKSRYMSISAKLTEAEFKSFQKDNLKTIYRIISGNKSYPMKTSLRWTVDNLGPFTIPKNGMCIKLDSLNYDLYENVLHKVEHSPIRKLSGRFYLNNQPVTHYTFKNNYYFMMGDNRDDSHDSRFWGFVADQNIEGVVVWKGSINPFLKS